MFDYRYLSSVSEEDVAFSSNPFENATTTNTSEIDIVGSGDPSADERSISILAQKEIIAIVLILPIIFILIIGFTCCFCPGFFSKIDDCVNNIGSQSDRVYGDAVVRRQIEEEEKNKEDPDERRARLDKHFEKHRVKMVRNVDMCLRPCDKWTDISVLDAVSVFQYSNIVVSFRLVVVLDKRIVS